MEARRKITEATDVNMTSKGQVLIPKAIRDRIGLKPGQTVLVGVNEQGQAVVLPKALDETPDERRQRIRAALERARGSMRTGFATTEAYMDMVRPHRLDRA
jgi:antitoxin PrlF